MEKLIFQAETGETVEFYVLEQTRVNGTNYLLVADSEVPMRFPKTAFSFRLGWHMQSMQSIYLLSAISMPTVGAVYVF